MHEYRLADAHAATNAYRPVNLRDASIRLDDWVLCRIYKKSTASEAISSFPSVRQQENEPKMTKTCSVSDFLEDYSAISHLFEDLPEMPVPEVVSNSGANQPMINYTSSTNGNGISYLVQKQPQTSSPSLIAGNCLKRRASPAEEEIAGPAQPSKKRNETCSFTTMARPFDGTQYHMMNQSLLNQNFLLNSHLGLH